jgi:hypothetical protein
MNQTWCIFVDEDWNGRLVVTGQCRYADWGFPTRCLLTGGPAWVRCDGEFHGRCPDYEAKAVKRPWWKRIFGGRS